MLPACVHPVLFYTLAEHLHAFHVVPKEVQLRNRLKLPLIAFYLKSCSLQQNEEQQGRQSKKIHLLNVLTTRTRDKQKSTTNLKLFKLGLYSFDEKICVGSAHF